MPISVTLSGMVISARLVQPENADPPIDVALSGMDISFRLVQSRKIPTSIVASFFGKSTFESDVQR